MRCQSEGYLQNFLHLYESYREPTVTASVRIRREKKIDERTRGTGLFLSSQGQILIEGVHNSLPFDLPSSYFVVASVPPRLTLKNCNFYPESAEV